MITRSARVTVASALAAVAIALFAVVGVASLAAAQTAPAAPAASAVQTRSPGARTANDGGYVDRTAAVLDLATLESRLAEKGLTVKEMEVEGLLLSVSAYDAQGRKVKLKLDRRTGEILSAKVKEARR